MEDFVTWHNKRTVNRIDKDEECSCNLKEEYKKQVGLSNKKCLDCGNEITMITDYEWFCPNCGNDGIFKTNPNNKIKLHHEILKQIAEDERK